MAQDMSQWMWAEALQLLDRAERAQRDVFRPGGAGRRRGACWEPPVDVFETADAIWIQVALPGVAPEQLEVGIEGGGTLVVAGERALPMPRGEEGVIRRLEMPYGAFERRVALPPGRYEVARRDLANGCLTLTLRKLG
jgi:HSP20 family molecular chaperone IbpA